MVYTPVLECQQSVLYDCSCVKRSMSKSMCTSPVVHAGVLLYSYSLELFFEYIHVYGCTGHLCPNLYNYMIICCYAIIFMYGAIHIHPCQVLWSSISSYCFTCTLVSTVVQHFLGHCSNACPKCTDVSEHPCEGAYYYFHVQCCISMWYTTRTSLFSALHAHPCTRW